MTGPTPIEPSSDIRQAASAYHQMYVAFVNEGFTEAQAVELVARVLAAAFTNQ